MARGHRDWGRVDYGLPGVNELDTYLTFNAFIAAADTVTRYLSMFNPANSGRRAQVRRIALNAITELQPLGTSFVEFRLFRTTTTGTGNPLTPRPTHTTFPASSLDVHDAAGVAPIESFELSHLFAAHERTLIDWQSYGAMPNLYFDLYRHEPGSAEAPLTIDPGEGLIFRVGTTGNDWQVAFLVHHTEELV